MHTAREDIQDHSVGVRHELPDCTKDPGQRFHGIDAIHSSLHSKRSEMLQKTIA